MNKTYLANRLIGLVILVFYVYILINKEKFAPGMQVLDQTKHLHHRASDGYDIITMLPLLGCACLILPNTFADLFSSKYWLFLHDLFTPGIFIFIGYVCLVVSWGLWALFV